MSKDKKSGYAMAEIPSRGKLNRGLSFGYVDVPDPITVKDRPFLNKLTADSLALQKKIRKGREIELKTEDQKIPCGYGEIPVRIYRPDGCGPFPMVLFYHGGGFAIRDLDCFDFLSRYFAKYGNAVVFTIDYALAPKHRFPVQTEQSYTALLWAREHAEKYGADPDRDAVLGDSAGGNLSAVVSMMCRDRGVPIPKRQLLAYPLVDERIEILRESDKLYGKGYNLDHKHLISYNKAYVEKEEEWEDPYVSPLLADSLSGMPECRMVLAECDILIDQGLEYARRLRDAEVCAEYQIFKGVPHDFLFYGFPQSYAACTLICEWIKEL